MSIDLSSVKDGLGIAAILVAWVVSLYVMVRSNAKKESDLYTAVAKVATDVDRVGEKVNATNLSCTKHDEAIQNLKIEQQQSRDDRMNMRERIAGNFTAISALQEELQQERLTVMATLHNNEKAAAERDTQTRVELARISERLDIEQMVHAVVRNFKGVET